MPVHSGCSYDAEFFEHLNSFFRSVPCRSGPSARLLAGKFGKDLDGLVHNLALLLLAQRFNKLMAITMETARSRSAIVQGI